MLVANRKTHVAIVTMVLSIISLCKLLLENAQVSTTIQIWTCLTITRQHMTAKPKLLSLILFLVHSEVKFREDIDPNSLK